MRRVLPIAFLRLLTIATPSCKKARLRAQLKDLCKAHETQKQNRNDSNNLIILL